MDDGGDFRGARDGGGEGDGLVDDGGDFWGGLEAGGGDFWVPKGGFEDDGFED